MPDYSGVMVAFFVPEEQAQKLALEGGQAPERLHVTLAYLGEVEEVEALDKLPAVVNQWADAQSPIEAKVGGVGVFNKREDNGIQAFYASVDSPAIQALRADLVGHLEAQGYKVKSEHGFTPHITLTYIPEGGEMPMREIEPVELVFEQASLSVGDERHDYPLAGNAQEVIQQIDGQWFLYSKDGGRRLGGPYETRDQAEDREQQIQFFKHRPEADPEPDSPDAEQDQERMAEDLAGKYSDAERALLSAGLRRFPGRVGISEKGRTNLENLVEQGLAYYDGLNGYRLTVAGMKLARALRKARRGEGMDNAIQAEGLTRERVKEEFASQFWPVQEAATDAGFTGAAWEVTLIGATSPNAVVRRDGQEYIRSRNGRLYSCRALAESASNWNGVRVFDNHLTDAEFQERQGMRSVAKEWVGTIIKPRWDETTRQLRGVFKVVDTTLREKLLEAHKHGVLSTVGLSIDTLPVMGRAVVEGRAVDIITGFQKIFSVDLVAEPAAGGGFNRLIASVLPGEDSETQDNQRVELYEWMLSHPGEAKEALKDVVRAALLSDQIGNGRRTERSEQPGPGSGSDASDKALEAISTWMAGLTEGLQNLQAEIEQVKHS